MRYRQSHFKSQFCRPHSTFNSHLGTMLFTRNQVTSSLFKCWVFAFRLRSIKWEPLSGGLPVEEAADLLGRSPAASASKDPHGKPPGDATTQLLKGQFVLGK